MARNTIEIPVPPEAVWAVLEDPYAYPEWVVGTDRTLEADATWPAPDSRFKVRFPGGLTDFTSVEEIDPVRRHIVLHAGNVVGPARVSIEVAARGGGSHVTIVEEPTGKVAPLRLLPPIHWLIGLRNTEGLRRLKELACRRR